MAIVWMVKPELLRTGPSREELLPEPSIRANAPPEVHRKLYGLHACVMAHLKAGNHMTRFSDTINTYDMGHVDEIDDGKVEIFVPAVGTRSGYLGCTARAEASDDTVLQDLRIIDGLVNRAGKSYTMWCGHKRLIERDDRCG